MSYTDGETYWLGEGWDILKHRTNTQAFTKRGAKRKAERIIRKHQREQKKSKERTGLEYEYSGDNNE